MAQDMVQYLKQLEVQYGNQQICAGIAYKLGIG